MLSSITMMAAHSHLATAQDTSRGIHGNFFE